MSGKIRESATLKRIEKKRRAKQMRLARNIALGLTGLFGLASMRPAEASDMTDNSVLIEEDDNFGSARLYGNPKITKDEYGEETKDNTHKATPTYSAATISGYRITMTGGRAFHLYGGYNPVEFGTDGKVKNYGTASNNTVTITDGTLVERGKVFGAAAYHANNNTVELNISSDSGDKLTATGGGYPVYDGGAILNGYDGSTASSNTVTLNGGTFQTIHGGHAQAENTGNKVFINGGRVTSGVYGGMGGICDNNSVEINIGTSAADADISSAAGAYGDTVTNNTVTLTSANAGIVSSAYGGEGAVAKNNKIIVNNGTITGSFYGAQEASGTSGQNIELTGNAVEIKGGTVRGTDIYGAQARSDVDPGESTTITGNTVTISGGTFTNGPVIYGGDLDGTVESGSNGATVSNNTITISGGKFEGTNNLTSIYAARVDSGTATAIKDNVVNLNVSNANFNYLYGAQGQAKEVSGNTLSIAGKDVSANSVNSFQKYNFVLPTSMQPGDSMLKVSYASINLASATTTASLANKNYSYTKGNYNLIKGGIKSGTSLGSYDISAITGIASFKDSKLAVSGNNLVLTLAGSGSIIVEGQDYAIGNEPDNTTAEPKSTGDVADYTAEITKDSTINIGAYGGATTKGNATNNKLIVSGGTVKAETSLAETFVMKDGKLTRDWVVVKFGRAEGGYTGEGNATGNTLHILDGTVGSGSDSVIGGGYSGKGSASKNTVTIEKGTVNGTIFGGNGTTTVENNEVTISGGAVEGNMVLGGYLNNTESGTAGTNKATVSGGTVGAVSPTALAGAYAAGVGATATGNTATLSGGALTGAVVGGATQGGGQATGNTATVSGGTLTGASVSYTGAKIPGAVVGGLAYDGSQATGNTVEITGGKIAGNTYVIGGLGNAAGFEVDASKAFGNNVTISGTPDLTTAAIYGSATYTVATETVSVEEDNKKDNVLNLSTQGVTAKNIYNFQTVNVDLSLLSDKPMLTLTEGQTDLGGAAFATTKTLSQEENIGPQGITGAVLANADGFTGTGGITTDWKAHDKYDYGFTVSDAAVEATIYQRTDNKPEVAAGTTVTGNVFGGRAMSDGNSATNNTLTIDGKVDKDASGDANAYGGYSEKANATGNTVELSGGSVSGDVYGGYSNNNGKTTGNTVTLAGTDVSASTMYGGNGADATGNTLNVDAAATAKNIKNFETIQFNKLPASATDAVLKLTEGDVDLTKTTVVVKPTGEQAIGAQGAKGTLISATGGTITGGTSDWTASGENGKYEHENTLNGDKNKLQAEVFQTKDHTAEVKEAVTGDVFGGKAQTTGNDATGNALTVSAAVTAEDGKEANAYGGFSKQGSATGNTLNVAADVANSVYAGYAEGTGNAGAEGKGNTLTITGGTMEAAYGGYAKGGSANFNTVNMTDGTVTGTGGDEPVSLFGGKSETGSADNNLVNFSGESVDEIFGGYTESGPSASKNTVNVTGGSFTGGQYGIVGGYAGESGTASGNEINITGGEGTVNLIYGGYGGATENNTVNLGSKNMTDSTKLALIQNAQIFGGSASATGNTLNVYASGAAAANVSNFQNLNFYLPEGFKVGTTAEAGDVALTLNGGEKTDVSNAKVGISAAGELNYKENDALWLIKNDKGVTANGATFSALDDTLSEYDIEIVTGDSGKGLIGKIGEISLKDGAKSLTETRATAMSFINLGGDMLVSQGIGGAVAAANAERFEGDRKSATAGGAENTDETAPAKSGRFTPFASIGGANQRAETGSHVDVRGWNFDLGFARAIENNSGVLTFGPFVEYGKGNYTSVLDDGTKGFGDTSYTGAGFFVRQDQNSGLWLEGSVRGGRTSSDYRGTIGTKDTTYDIDNNYYGAHLGVGKILPVKDDAEVDIYGRFFYTHQDSASADVKVNGKVNRFDFDATDSARLRLGARWTKHMDKRNSLYAGLAYEYEFCGDADGTRVTATRRDATGTPSLKGSSGMFEFGWLMSPSDRSPITLDLGLTGWVGRRQGFGAHLSMSWSL